MERMGEALECLVEWGVEGLEIAPSKIWKDTWNIPFKEVESFRMKVESCGIKIVGIHSLFWDQPHMNIFGEKAIQKTTGNFLVHLANLCSDLGGVSMVFGSPNARKQNNLSMDQANLIAAEFFSGISENIDKAGCSLLIEALDPEDTNYINSASEALELIEKVNHPGFSGQLDAKSLYGANEIRSSTFKAFKDILVHVHVNDPGLVVVGETGLIDHVEIGRLLENINYQGYVSIEQKTINTANPLEAVKQSVAKVKECYLK